MEAGIGGQNAADRHAHRSGNTLCIDWEMVYASSTTSGASVVKTDQELQNTLLRAMNQRLGQIQFVYQGKTNQLKGQLKQALEEALESDPYMNYTIESYGYSYSGSSKSANVSCSIKLPGDGGPNGICLPAGPEHFGRYDQAGDERPRENQGDP
ncbi:hypothetical protein VQ056_23710 [Paenibacillus sp. JTLBN-2024]